MIKNLLRFKSYKLFVLLLFLYNSCADQSVAVKDAELECPEEQVIHSGEATYYDPNAAQGNCSYDSIPSDFMIGAMNAVDYAGSQICGACIRITGPNGTVVVKIIDQCPECPKGNVDLSPQAFSKIANLARGRVSITWQLTACDIDKPIEYHYKNDVNQWWMAVQIRNHRYPVYSLEYLTPQNTFKSLGRVDYNYFVDYNGIGRGPFTFRVTDIYGHVLVDSSIVLDTKRNIPGMRQFPLCNP